MHVRMCQQILIQLKIDLFFYRLTNALVSKPMIQDLQCVADHYWAPSTTVWHRFDSGCRHEFRLDLPAGSSALDRTPDSRRRSPIFGSSFPEQARIAERKKKSVFWLIFCSHIIMTLPISRMEINETIQKFCIVSPTTSPSNLNFALDALEFDILILLTSLFK